MSDDWVAVESGHFDEFCHTYEELRKELGLRRYLISFEHGGIQGNSFAESIIHESHARAHVRLTNKVFRPSDWPGVRFVALHEVLHLMMARLMHHACRRPSGRKNEMVRAEEEAIVCLLSQILLPVLGRMRQGYLYFGQKSQGF